MQIDEVLELINPLGKPETLDIIASTVGRVERKENLESKISIYIDGANTITGSSIMVVATININTIEYSVKEMAMPAGSIN